MNILLHILGLDSVSGRWYAAWSGVGGDVTIVGAVIGWLRRSARQHAEKLAQDARHHREMLEQADGHHKAHMDLLRRQHSQLTAPPAGGDRM